MSSLMPCFSSSRRSMRSMKSFSWSAAKTPFVILPLPSDCLRAVTFAAHGARHRPPDFSKAHLDRLNGDAQRRRDAGQITAGKIVFEHRDEIIVPAREQHIGSCSDAIELADGSA